MKRPGIFVYAGAKGAFPLVTVSYEEALIQSSFGQAGVSSRPGIQEFQKLLDTLNSQTKCNTLCIRCCNGTML